MAHKRRTNTTKLEIIQIASRMFLEKGYSKTTIKSISDELDISAGHLMFYFPTKEHLLLILVDLLCDFQWKMMQNVVEEGNTSLMALCLELATMASMCEEDEIAKDFYLSAYSHPITLSQIRKNDVERAKLVFGEYCAGWSDEQFAEAEILVSGAEFSTLMVAGDPVPLDLRVSGAINHVLSIYMIPEEIRKTMIEKTLNIDYRAIGRKILEEFKNYVEVANESAFDEMLQA